MQLNQSARLHDSGVYRRIDGGTDNPASDIGYHLLYDKTPVIPGVAAIVARRQWVGCSSGVRPKLLQLAVESG